MLYYHIAAVGRRLLSGSGWVHLEYDGQPNEMKCNETNHQANGTKSTHSRLHCHHHHQHNLSGEQLKVVKRMEPHNCLQRMLPFLTCFEYFRYASLPIIMEKTFLLVSSYYIVCCEILLYFPFYYHLHIHIQLNSIMYMLMATVSTVCTKLYSVSIGNDFLFMCYWKWEQIVMIWSIWLEENRWDESESVNGINVHIIHCIIYIYIYIITW